jgi:hypothetical protein
MERLLLAAFHQVHNENWELIHIEILNWRGSPWEGDEGGVKRTRGDEPTVFVIHICKEISQGNSLCSYFYLKLAKTSYFSSYLLWFFFYKIGEQESRRGPAGGRWEEFGAS